MRALLYDDCLHTCDDYPAPTPPDGESLVRVTLAGVCTTDVELTRGYNAYRGIIGHEFVGVAETGPHAGQRVVGEINASCGHCAPCVGGHRTHCLNRTVLGIWKRDGAMAQWLTLPDENLHIVPPSLRDEQAVFVEPLAAALEILDGAHIKPTERVVVIGDGKLGQLVTQALALTGCDLTLVGRHGNKLELARRRAIGVCLATDANGLHGADVVVDCTGSADGFALAAQLVRARGRIVLKSTFHGGQQVALTPLVVREVTLIGSRCGPFDAALRVLTRGLVDVESLISDVLPLSAGVAAFARAQQSGVLKVLLRPND